MTTFAGGSSRRSFLSFVTVPANGAVGGITIPSVVGRHCLWSWLPCSASVIPFRKTKWIWKQLYRFHLPFFWIQVGQSCLLNLRVSVPWIAPLVSGQGICFSNMHSMWAMWGLPWQESNQVHEFWGWQWAALLKQTLDTVSTLLLINGIIPIGIYFPIRPTQLRLRCHLWTQSWLLFMLLHSCAILTLNPMGPLPSHYGLDMCPPQLIC